MYFFSYLVVSLSPENMQTTQQSRIEFYHYSHFVSYKSCCCAWCNSCLGIVPCWCRKKGCGLLLPVFSYCSNQQGYGESLVPIPLFCILLSVYSLLAASWGIVQLLKTDAVPSDSWQMAGTQRMNIQFLVWSCSESKHFQAVVNMRWMLSTWQIFAMEERRTDPPNCDGNHQVGMLLISERNVWIPEESERAEENGEDNSHGSPG